MAKGFAHIQVEGYQELQKDIKVQLGKLPASLGAAHKEIGRFVIGRLPTADPHAVGAGSGADVRPSATKRDVIIRAGHAGREDVAAQRRVPTAYIQWGKKEVQPFVRDRRPYIVGTIEANQEAIEQKFIDEVTNALAPAFYDAD